MVFYFNKKIFFSKKHFLNKFIFLLLFIKVISQFSFINEYFNQIYPKVYTMSNGYKLIISALGIYSFYPNISKIAYFFQFTLKSLTIKSYEEAQSFISNADISQF